MGMNLGLNLVAQYVAENWLGLKRRNRRNHTRGDSPANLEVLEQRELLTTFTVTTALDDSTSASTMSLREAINAANASPGADTIRFDSALSGQSFLLTQGALTITDPLTIVGLGATNTVINAQQKSRVFALTSSAGDVTLDSLTVKSGRTDADGQMGAGIFSESNGTLTVENSSVNANATFGNWSQGGGIYNSNGAVVVINSTISGNTTNGNYAPGAGVATTNGDITLVNTTISNNITAGANSSGGGVATFCGDVTLTNTTVTQNATLGPFSSGGGLFSGALSTQHTSAVTINNSIVAQNVSYHSTYMDISKNTGVTTMAINSSLIGVGDGTGFAEAPLGAPDLNGNLIGTFANKVDPKLGPLAYNGGTTKTHALLPNSPAIDMGNNGLALNPAFTVLTADQKGQIRAFDTTVDMGSYELETVPSAPTVSFSTAAQNVGEGAGVITVTVNLSNSSSHAITIPFTFSGTATNLVDYSCSTSSLVIPAGATSGTISLMILDDSAVQSNESLVIKLGTPVNATLGSISTETLTIVDSSQGAPTSLNLSAQNVTENVANAVVGTLTSTDPTLNNTESYSIQSGGQGSLFTIVGNQLKVGATGLNYESLTGGVALVNVRVTNSIGAFLDKQFAITVKDVNEAPSMATGQAFSAPLKASFGTVVGNVVASDPDLTAPFNKLTYSIVGGNTNQAFTIDKVTGQITVASSSALNTSGKKFTLQIKVTDGGSPALGITQTVTVQTVTPFLVKLTGNVGKITTAPNAAVSLDPLAALTNLDSNTNLTAARVTISETGGGSAADTLFVRTAGAVKMNGSTILVNGVVVGHTTGGVNGLPLSINFTAGSKTAVNAVLSEIAMQTVHSTSSQPTRTLKFLVTVGGFSASTNMTAKVV
ncbi:MAG: hlyA 4 [Planctomycetaceae bacterium]|nr:hlyA 4 [Planctomycetaceae bacterium]